jgi:uncharacterized protein with LGFP repeats
LVVNVTDDPTTLSLTWSSGESGPWNVYRDGALVASSPTRDFTDTGLVTGQEYSYQVQTPGYASSTAVTPSSALSAAVAATPVVRTDIGRFYRDHPETLGPVTVLERAIAGGRQQDHQNGLILQQDGETPLAVTNPLATSYVDAGGATGDLGFPVVPQENGLRDGGSGQLFEGGSIWNTGPDRTWVVFQLIEDGWDRTGWEEGPLGYPVDDLVELDGGFAQEFEGGAVYWSEATGSHGVSSPIYDRWAAAGYEDGPLGYPLTDARALPNGGQYQQFQGGYVYSTAATGAWSVRGAIRTAWAGTGSEKGPLGYPLTDARALPNGGQYQQFQGGYVYWTAATGAWPVRGAMRTAWARTGSEKGPLGYPMSGEVALRNGGRYQKFQGGYVYWTAATGAWAVRGAIRTAWARTGSENGRLGYPTSDETGTAAKRRQTFQRGTITVDVATGRSAITYR